MTVDGLTQLFNRRYFNEALEREVQPLQALRTRRSRSHLRHRPLQARRTTSSVTSRATRSFVSSRSVVKPRLRREDIFSRVGGEEFAAILPEIDRAGAVAVAEKIRDVVASSHFAFEELVMPCTVSIGVAELDLESDEPKSLYARADAALYRAKSTGRNRVME